MLSEFLTELAKASPAHYAPLIKARNLALLGQLGAAESSDDPAAECERLLLGCPHCGPLWPCGNCLYNRGKPGWGEPRPRGFKRSMLPAFFQSCTDVKYGGVSLKDIHKHQTISVTYSHSYCELRVTRGPLDPGELAATRGFLEAHVEWASLPCWGENYRETE